MGGATPTALTDIEYVTIATEGNAVDFGDLLTVARYWVQMHLMIMVGCKNRSLVLY